MNHKQFAFFLLFIVSLIWGFAAVVIKFTLEGISPLPFLTYRFLISASIAIAIFALTKNKYSYKPKTWLGIFIYSILSTTFALGFLFLGLDKTTVLELSLITLIGPLITSYAGVVFLNEHITKREKIGTLIAFLGTIFTIVEPILNAEDNFSGITGNILLFVYLVVEVASVILLKKLVREKVPPLFLTNISFTIGFIVLIPISFVSLGINKF
ncbi:MAG: DMT family transporter, partial [Patescibacteria group bacterium]|nr:DMT family transporter [Patescibacteria group bacterium]